MSSICHHLSHFWASMDTLLGLDNAPVLLPALTVSQSLYFVVASLQRFSFSSADHIDNSVAYMNMFSDLKSAAFDLVERSQQSVPSPWLYHQLRHIGRKEMVVVFDKLHSLTQGPLTSHHRFCLAKEIIANIHGLRPLLVSVAMPLSVLTVMTNQIRQTLEKPLLDHEQLDNLQHELHCAQVKIKTLHNSLVTETRRKHAVQQHTQVLQKRILQLQSRNKELEEHSDMISSQEPVSDNDRVS